MGFFRSRAFSAGNAAIFLTFASLFSAVFFYAQLLQTGLGYDPLGAGLRLMPWTATFITVAPIAGALVDRIGERPFMVAGLTPAGGGPGLAGADRRARHGLLADARAVHRRRASASRWPSRPRRTRSSDRWPTSALGKAAGANSMMRELGGVFGIAVVVAVFAGAGSYASPAGVHRRLRAGDPRRRRPGARRRGRRARAARPPRRAPRRSSPAFRRRRHEAGHGSLQGQARSRRPRTRRSCAPSTRSCARTAPDGPALRDLPAGRRRQLRPRLASRPRTARNPLTEVEAFARFQEGIGERCDEPPVVTELTRGRVLSLLGDEAA